MTITHNCLSLHGAQHRVRTNTNSAFSDRVMIMHNCLSTRRGNSAVFADGTYTARLSFPATSPRPCLRILAIRSPLLSLYLTSTAEGASHQLVSKPHRTANSPPSCVRTIQDTLQILVPSPHSIHVSILSQCVTVHHPTGLSPLAIREAIQDAGFDIADTPGASQLRLSDTLDSSSRSQKAAVHLEQCQYCQHELKSALETSSIQQLTSETTAIRMDGPLRLSLSVGGMTCAACSSTITRLLSEERGVTDVSVNLMGNSATLIVKSKELISVVREVIESAGYEASVVGIEPLQVTPDAMEVVHGKRTVALRIEGMFCE